LTDYQLGLIGFCIVGLLMMAACSVGILRLQARQEKMRQRVQSTAGPYRRRATEIPQAVTTGVALQEAKVGWVGRAQRILGFDPLLQDHYVMKWWLALILALVLATVLTDIASSLVGAVSWIALLPVWIFLSRNFFAWCERRRRNMLFVQFPDALSMIVRGVRVGIPATDSIRAVGREMALPTGPEFARLSDELAIGVPLDEALRVMAERNGLQEYRFFATAMSLQAQTGGGLSETLDNLADVIRKRVAVRQKGIALSAEAKMSATVLAVLPPIAAAGLWVMNPSYISLLVTDPTGKKILAAAIITLGFGIWSMQTLIRKSLT
jgi:tight adherence protein B